MRISHYDFGRVEVGGKVYTSDVIISSAKVKDGWWRKEGHRLSIEDLDDAVSTQPQLLIVGTGFYGNMVVPHETRDYLVSKSTENPIDCKFNYHVSKNIGHDPKNRTAFSRRGPGFQFG